MNSVINNCMRKQTKEHIEKRIKRGENHPNWVGDVISEKGGRARALRIYKVIPNCRICNSSRSERHHKDGNTANNSKENMDFLCRRCHMSVDGRIKSSIKRLLSNTAFNVEMSAMEKRARTHCKRGHPLSGDNVYLFDNHRHCKQCRKLRRINASIRPENNG